MNALPKLLIETMSEEIAYGALKDSGYIKNLPAYVAGSYYVSEACAEEFQRLGKQLSQKMFWTAATSAHDAWRALPEVKLLVTDERCANNLNMFACLELAGLDAFLVWARRLERWFRLMGFDFDSGFDDGDFGPQLAWVREVHWDASSTVAGIFLKNRRLFAEQSGLVDQRDLYQYVINTNNDVFGVCAWHCDEPQEVCVAKVQIQRKLYVDDNDSLAYRLTRQILLANGGGAPISW